MKAMPLKGCIFCNGHGWFKHVSGYKKCYCVSVQECLMPNMDEVVRQVKEELDEITEGEWVSDGFGTIIIAHSGRIIASVYAPEDFKIVANGPEWLRLLIEERDTYKLWLENNQADLLKSDLARAEQDMELKEIHAMLTEQIEDRKESTLHSIEQDKEIQRLQKFEDTLKLFKLNGASDIYGWLEEQGIDI